MRNKKAPHNAEPKLNRMQHKDKYFLSQKQVFYKYLLHHTATATMATEATGIPQKNLTRYKRELEDEGKLIEVIKTICKHTKCRAAYLSTNPAIINTLKKKRCKQQQY